MERYFCLRFDIDTDLCLRSGVPNLLELGRRTGTRFTFFATPGRAVSRVLAIARLFGLRAAGPDARHRDRLGALQKLGAAELMRLVALNPRLMPRHAQVLRHAVSEGHEVGLHGGRNHGRWQARAQAWSRRRLARELDRGIAALHAAGIYPAAFASPGWNSPPDLPALLAERGFTVVADEHGTAAGPRRLDDGDLVAVPTLLTGEPGGVGYLEWHRARGTPTDEIAARVRRHLDDGQALVCLYDHPFYAGIRELGLLERLLAEARAGGRSVAPLGPAARAILSGSAADATAPPQ